MKMLAFVSNMSNIPGEKQCKLDFTIQDKA